MSCRHGLQRDAMTSELITTGIGLGDYVHTMTHDYRGRVTDLHFGCPEGRAWIMGQEVPIRDEALDSLYPWLTVLVHGGGAVVVPAYDIELTEPFEFVNPWADHYWPREYGQEA